jgi:hypothetical protein
MLFKNITGTNPQAGYDVEPNSSYDRIENIVIDSVRSEDCTGSGGKIDPNALSDPIFNDSGSHDGSNNASTLTDSSQSWGTDVFVGRRVHNLSDDSSGTITANTATTITATLSGGTDNDWDSGDRYRIIASHDGSANASALTDSLQSWTTDEFVGRTIVNLTDNSSGVITANTDDTITATLSGGTDNDWDSGDEYNFASTFTVTSRDHEDFSSVSGMNVGSLDVGNSIIQGRISIERLTSREAENPGIIVRNYDVNGPIIEFFDPKIFRPNQAGSSSVSLGAAILLYAPSGDTGAITLGNVTIHNPEIEDDQGNVTNYIFARDQRTSSADMEEINILGKIKASGQSTGTSMMDFFGGGVIEDLGEALIHAATGSYSLGANNYTRYVTNEGATGTVTVTLDSAGSMGVGTRITFYVVDAQTLRIDPPSGARIQPGGNADGDYIQSSNVGARLEIEKVSDTLWKIINEVDDGPWTRET